MVAIRLIDADAKQIGAPMEMMMEGPTSAPDGVDISEVLVSHNALFELNQFAFPAFGTYWVEVQIEGERELRCRLVLRRK